jgi:hypothetical protein
VLRWPRPGVRGGSAGWGSGAVPVSSCIDRHRWSRQHSRPVVSFSLTPSPGAATGSYFYRARSTLELLGWRFWQGGASGTTRRAVSVFAQTSALLKPVLLGDGQEDCAKTVLGPLRRTLKPRPMPRFRHARMIHQPIRTLAEFDALGPRRRKRRLPSGSPGRWR